MSTQRFPDYSRGVFESGSILRHDRKWDGGSTRSRGVLFVSGLLVLIGGVFYVHSRSVESRTISWVFARGSGGADDPLQPLVGVDGEVIGLGGGSRSGDDGGDEVVSESSVGVVSIEEEGGAESGGGGESRAVREIGNQEKQEEEKEKEKKEEEEIQEYLERKQSPLAQFAGTIHEGELDAGVSGLSRLVISIAGAESNFGRLSRFHNAWGIKCGLVYYCRYSSWAEGIQAITMLLSGSIYNLGTEVTAEDIWRIAPVYAEDPRWPHNVSYFWWEQE